MQGKKPLTHRDFSWLKFNQRVLSEAKEKGNPLLERVKFLSIAADNLNEFITVRLAHWRRLVDFSYNQEDKFGYYPFNIYRQLKQKIKESLNECYGVYFALKDKLAQENIHIKNIRELDDLQRGYVEEYFNNTLFPVITPTALDPAHPFPVLPSQSIVFAVQLNKSEEDFFALLRMPKVIPRFLPLPSDKNIHQYIAIEQIIGNYIKVFFRGYSVKNFFVFRIIRDSELHLEEEAEDILQTIKDNLYCRQTAPVVWMEVLQGAPKEFLEGISEKLGFDRESIVFWEELLDLSCLLQIRENTPLENLKFRSFLPKKVDYENIFQHIEEEERIYHLPYQSFHPVLDFIKQAANDPQVLAIKITLYRTYEKSAVIEALKEAANNGKQVTVVLELKARFEEWKNINWVKELVQAGCHVVYGIKGMKVHSKMALVVRQEEGGIKRYAHLSTGNYNESTAGIYTDIGYFTANEDVCRDISEIFNVITGYSLPQHWQRIVSSPYQLRNYLKDLINKEIEFKQKHGRGVIFAKMNALEDVDIINNLYYASQQGVKIKLLVRGICCLLPQIKGISENIEVHSIIGRFLEHSRIYMFYNNGAPRFFISSADWMERNFDYRIEFMVEILSEGLKNHLYLILEKYWQDNTKAWHLDSKGNYFKSHQRERVNAQNFFMGYYSE